MATISSPQVRPAVSRPAVVTLRPFLILATLLVAVLVSIRPIAVPPAVSTAPTAPSAFSAERAKVDLVQITQTPRVMASPELDQARTYLAEQFRALGLETEINSSTIIRQAGPEGFVAAAESTILVARLRGQDSTGAILIGGHLDSVHTTPAASDCGGCAVGVLEVARALAAGDPLRNDIIFLIEDGEETTRAGALVFVQEHPWAAEVRVALNQEAMGTAGGSLLYVTGPENGWLMDQALQVLPSPVAYSWVNDLVWGTGTGGSDLDQFLMAAEVGVGFAYLGNVPAYHSMADSVANLDLYTYQQQGDNLLALARHLGNLPLPATLTAPSRVYFNLFEHTVVRYSATVGMGIALLVLVGYVMLVGLGLRRGQVRLGAWAAGAGMTPVMVAVACAVAAGLWQGLRSIDPRLQPMLLGVSYDRGAYTVAFALLAAAVTLGGCLALRRMSWRDLGLGALIWWVILAVLTAFLAPGSSPLFAFPALLALIPLGMSLLGRDRSRWVDLAWTVAAVGALLLVVPVIQFLGIFSGRAEVLMLLPVVGLFPAPLAAMLTLLLLPLWERILGARRWIAPALALSVAAVILMGIGLSATFTPDRPKPNTVVYLMDESGARWITFGSHIDGGRASLIDEWTGHFFPAGTEPTTFNPWGAYHVPIHYPAYQAPAPRADLPLPEITVVADEVDAEGLRRVQFAVTSPSGAIMHYLRTTTQAEIVAATLNGRALDEVNAAGPHDDLAIELFGFSEEAIQLELRIRGEGEVVFWVEDRLYTLPTLAEMEIAPRPAWMMPSQGFVSDSTLLRRSVTLP